MWACTDGPTPIRPHLPRNVAEIVRRCRQAPNRLKRLETRNLVARVPNAQDARSNLVQLTDEGLALIERAVEAHVDNERTVLSALSDDVLRDLDTQLAHLLRALERGADGDDDGAALAA